MYFNQVSNTNIDDQLKLGRNRGIGKKILRIIVITLVVVAGIGALGYFIYNNTRYTLKLNGDKNVTVYQGSLYNDPGYIATDREKNNLRSEVTITSDLDSSIAGEYTITYSLRDKTKTRKIKVIEGPITNTELKLIGDKNITLNIGDTYTEPGYNATDIIDDDITDKVKTYGTVDTSVSGVYRIVYIVVNSSGITTSEVRTIYVQ